LSSFVITKLATTAIIFTLINIQPKLAFALPDLVFKTDRSSSELESFKQCGQSRDRTLNWTSSDIEALLCRADLLVERGSKQGVLEESLEYYRKALEDYSLALRFDHTNPEIYYKRAILRDRMGDREGALDDYTKIIQITPNYQQVAPVYTEKYLTLAHNQRGYILLAMGQIAKAEKDFTTAIAINPNYGEPYLGRASALFALGNKQQAETNYSNYLRFYPTNSKGYYYRGVVRHQLGNLEGALADYDQAIRLNDKFSEAYYNRAVVYDSLNNGNAALDNYQQALSLNQKIFTTDNRPRARG
jgi:tetratricopeptide (TPR) repeat protein